MARGTPKHILYARYINPNVKWYGYWLINDKGDKYIGISSTPIARLSEHNRGRTPSTAKGRPWRHHECTLIGDSLVALAVESYARVAKCSIAHALKSHDKTYTTPLVEYIRSQRAIQYPKK